TFCITFICSAVWSSVSITRTFGRSTGGAGPAAARFAWAAPMARALITVTATGRACALSHRRLIQPSNPVLSVDPREVVLLSALTGGQTAGSGRGIVG